MNMEKVDTQSQPSHHTMKLLRWAILFPIAVTSTDGHSHDPFSCGSPDATDVELSLQSQALGIFQARLAESSNMDKEIPVCFHVVTDNNGGGEVSETQLQDALEALNEGYGPNSCCDTGLDWCNEGDCSVDTGFTFTMAGIDENGNYVSGITYDNVTTQGACVTRTLNSGWSNVIQTDDGVMKNALHKGDPRKVMNVYWVNRVVETSGRSVLAYATLPFFNVGNIDGVVIIAALAPNGGATELDSGDVLIHEVGHWLGLQHTFAGGCSISDGIPDTPPQAEPNYGCDSPLSIDTCPGGGSDPVSNFMDYSNNACMFKFTPHQKATMEACWEVYRLGNSDRPDIELTIGVPSASMDLAPLENQMFILPDFDGVVKCTTRADSSEGNLDLYLTVNDRVSFNSRSDYCASVATGNNESCKSLRTGLFSRIFSRFFHRLCGRGGGTSGTLYVGVRAESDVPVKGVQVECNYD